MFAYFRIRQTSLVSLSALSVVAVLVASCSSDDEETSTTDPTTTTDTEVVGADTETPETIDTGSVSISVDPTAFVEGALASDPTVVDCTLSDGTETSCYEIVTVGVPADSAVGPFCPRTINSTAADSGIWQDGTGTVYQADGEFIVALPNIYGDSNWQLYDLATGDVNVTDTQEACEAAARPDVEEQYQNHCVECSLDYVDGGVSATYLIPVTPTPADVIGTITNAGVSLNGVQLAGPAPVDAILSAYTIAAFDDCGGHVNPNDGYHYHAATGCTELSDTQDDGHASLLGYAMDGYGIYGMLDSEGNETDGLDECRGHTDDTRGYHYHSAGAGENMFIGCFTGKTVGATTGPGPGGPGGPREAAPQ